MQALVCANLGWKSPHIQSRFSPSNREFTPSPLTESGSEIEEGVCPLVQKLPDAIREVLDASETITPGRRVVYPNQTPMTILFLSMQVRMGAVISR